MIGYFSSMIAFIPPSLFSSSICENHSPTSVEYQGLPLKTILDIQKMH